MADPEEDIKGLDQRALRITPPTVLVPLALLVADIIEHAAGQAGRGHVLAPGQEGPDLVEEDFRGAFLVHALQRGDEILQAVGESAQQRA